VADVGGGRAGSAGFFDAAWCGNVVPRDSFYGLLAEHGERIVGDRDFVECYSERRGRPSIPPSTLARILLLAYRCGLSDRQAMEAVRFDLRWKVALGLPLDHEGFHPTSLVKFRARLLWRVPAPREGAPHAPHALGGRPGSAYLSRQSRLGRPSVELLTEGALCECRASCFPQKTTVWSSTRGRVGLRLNAPTSAPPARGPNHHRQRRPSQREHARALILRGLPA
jgi:hypothetical protein